MTPPSLTKAISRVFLNDANLAADIDTYLKVGGVCLCNCFISDHSNLLVRRKPGG